MNETTKTIAEQVNAKELVFARFNVLTDDENNALHIKKGKKFVVITYNRGSDAYDLRVGSYNKKFEIKEEVLEGMYFDSLKDVIQRHFKFEYVMHMFRGC